jgi:PKD repeat protein
MGERRNDGDKFSLNLTLTGALFFICMVSLLTITQAITDIPLEGTETRITVLTNDSRQSSPDVSGNTIVWLDNRDCCAENPLCCGDFRTYHPYIYQIDTGIEKLLWSEGDGEPETPAIYNTRIVWAEMNYTSFTYDIKMYDTLSEETMIIGSENGLVSPVPKISDQFIVWQTLDDVNFTYGISGYSLASGMIDVFVRDLDFTLAPNPDVSGSSIVWQAYNFTENTYEVYYYDLMNPASRSLIASNISTTVEPRPRISGDLIVWQVYNNTSNFIELFLHKPTLPQPIIIPDLPYSLSFLPNPEASGDRVVYTSYMTTNTDVYLYDLNNDTRSLVTLDAHDQVHPAMAGNRIVWEDRRLPFEDIFLYTIGTPVTCPSVDFQASPLIGGAPLVVEFNDTSTGIPTTWTWNFGEGNSSQEQNPSHTYYASGSYSIALIVSTIKCRDGVQKENLITVGVPPTTNFSATPLSGYEPLEVKFTDLSTGSPSEWNWSFGDESWFNTTNISERSPIHLYSSAGSYNVTLIVNSSFGSSSRMQSDYISVLKRTGSNVSTAIEGLIIEQVGDRQFISYDTSILPDYTNTPNSTLWFVPPPENGIENITLFTSDATGFLNNAGILNGNISGVLLVSDTISLEGFSPEVGTECSMKYQMNLSTYPMNALITSYQWEGAIPSDYQSLLKVAYGSNFNGISDVAYVVQLVKNKVPEPHDANIIMSVNSTWVANNGGREKIWVVRIGDDQTGEVLPTTFIMTDTTKNLDYFRAESPRGLSKFALTALYGTGNPLQIIVLIVQQLFSPGSDSSSDGVPTFTPTKTPTPTPTLTPVPTISPPEGTGILPIDSEGALTESIEIQSKDLSGTLSIFADTKALTAHGTPLSNISIRRLNADEIASLPLEEGFNGIAYELLPDGATFDTPIVLTLAVPEETWSDSKRYLLQWYNRTSEQWEPISTTTIADSHTLIAQISHFSIIGLFSYELPTTTVTTEIPTTSPPVTTTPSSLFVGLLAMGVGIVWWTRGRR